MNTWGIIGLGWLGSALADSLRQQGIAFWGTHRVDFDWNQDPLPDKFCDLLFLNTPPLKQLSAADFVSKIPVQKSQRIIFISSTSVYGSVQGKVFESTTLQPDTENGLWLRDVEHLLLKKFKTDVCIIRPGGLIGGTRHPVYHLTGKSRIADGQGPVNLIHRDDLVRIIEKVTTLPELPSIVNAAAPFHPSREEYYNGWAQKLGLSPIEFLQDPPSGKTVSSEVLNGFYHEWSVEKLDRL